MLLDLGGRLRRAGARVGARAKAKARVRARAKAKARVGARVTARARLGAQRDGMTPTPGKRQSHESWPYFRQMEALSMQLAVV
jgi:hypothetical protein